MTHPWAVADYETGVVHAVFQQMQDYLGGEPQHLKICDDGNGNLIIEYDPVPEVAEEAPEEVQVVNDYAQEVEHDGDDQVFRDWNAKWMKM